MKFRIIYIGKDKKNHHSEAEKLYLKRLKNYVAIELVQLKPEKYSKSLSATEIKAKEAKIFEKELGANSRVILLDENGKQYDSMNFSKFVEQQTNLGGRVVNFVIGGAYGFSDMMKDKYKTKLALSSLTYAHHLARLVLLEQIYRAMTILNNEPYHNS